MTPDWTKVPEWCLGANDRFGTCFFAMVGNWLALYTGEIMPDGEIENAAREMEGFSPYDPSTDHGELMVEGIKHIVMDGWPGDPILRPARVDDCDVAEVVEVVSKYGCAFAALALPADQDFSDHALEQPGMFGHAVFVVQADDESVRFITWARVQVVSRAWWDHFARQLFGPVWPGNAAG